MSSKNKEKHLVGKPIFRQIVDFMPRNKVRFTLPLDNNSYEIHYIFNKKNHKLQEKFTNLILKQDNLSPRTFQGETQNFPYIFFT
jgi:hypothetical protein